MTTDQLLTIVTVTAEVLGVFAVALVAAGSTAMAVGMWLHERARCYRLPYEQPSHVRLLRGDES